MRAVAARGWRVAQRKYNRLMPTHTSQAIRTARRVDRFTYAIRQVVAEAKKVEQAGTTVRYLNIGDPNAFGFLTPPHLIEAVDRAMRDGHNGYAPSPGIAPDPLRSRLAAPA